ncbi:MAG: UDP-2,3-diacylglucosamine diphosphatase [Pseudomonadota bacterium]
MKAEPGHSLLIADLHLTPEQPGVTARFHRFLAEIAPGAQALYILGDLFEAWPGDDFADHPYAADILAGLHRLTHQGVALRIMHGNRDFLLGPGFCARSGASLLSDPSLVNLHGTPTLLLHGDSLCTDDVAYQAVRNQVRDPTWQAALLARPLPERLALARQYRAQSETDKAGKPLDIMDVNEAAVHQAFRSHGCPRLIHGHTHRPARHPLSVDGQTVERWVLPDWTDERGGYLRCDVEGCRALPW